MAHGDLHLADVLEQRLRSCVAIKERRNSPHLVLGGIVELPPLSCCTWIHGSM